MAPAVLTKASLLPHLKTFCQNVFEAFSGLPLTPLKVGLCISGGPDSMALASLMASLTKRDLGFEIAPVAFVIDHNARPGSSEEARAVSEQLSKLQIPSYIGRIQWGNENPSQMTNFESQARARRYDELTMAAIRSGIRHLFLGHHRDDQVETVLLRLIRSEEPSFLGLRGMEANGPISVSHSIYGARQEVPAVSMKEILQNQESGIIQAKTLAEGASLSSLPKFTFIRGADNINGYAPGGIQIHRPLLNFRKSDLIATCDANSIPYIVDKTNSDPKFTLRNAVRALRSYQLPKALQSGSILKVAASSESHSRKLQSRIQEYLQTVTILTFDLRSATATVRLPADFEQLAKNEKPVAAGVLAQLCQLVTPMSAEKVQTLEQQHKLDNLLSHIRSPFWKRRPGTHVPSFSCSKVQLEGLLLGPGNGDCSTSWRLSRQAMRPREIETSTIRFASTKTSTIQNGGQDNIRKCIHVSDWILWDNRYWIQITAADKRIFDHLIIRPFLSVDWEPLVKNFPEAIHGKYRVMMKDHAPGRIRYTLPVLEFHGSIIAFPTLSDQVFDTEILKQLSPAMSHAKPPCLKWQANYKVLPESIVKWISSNSGNVDNHPPSRSEPTCTLAGKDLQFPSSYRSRNQTLPSLSAHVVSPAPSE